MFERFWTDLNPNASFKHPIFRPECKTSLLIRITRNITMRVVRSHTHKFKSIKHHLLKHVRLGSKYGENVVPVRGLEGVPRTLPRGGCAQSRWAQEWQSANAAFLERRACYKSIVVLFGALNEAKDRSDRSGKSCPYRRYMALVNMNHDLFFCEDVMWRCNPPYGASRSLNL